MRFTIVDKVELRGRSFTADCILRTSSIPVPAKPAQARSAARATRRLARRLNPLVLLAVGLAALVAMPVLSVLANLFAGGTSGTWSHLAATVLPEYIGNTLWLFAGVGAGVTLIGVSTAWLTTMHEFPGRRHFEWALVLPMAMPAYVLAYVYTDLLQFVGPVQGFLRESFGWKSGDYRFPQIRS